MDESKPPEVKNEGLDPKAAEAQVDVLLQGTKSSSKSNNKAAILIATGLVMLAVVFFAFTALSGSDDDETVTTNIQSTSVADDETDTATQSDTQTTASEYDAYTSTYSSSYSYAAVDGCPEASNFIDVSMFDGPGSDYPDPELTVSCDGDDLVVQTNSVPHYTFVPTTPNELTAQDYTFSIPRNPVMASEATAIYNSGTDVTLGTLGFAVNGAVWFGPTEGAQPVDSAYGDPVYNALLDSCQGHTSDAYHYHALETTCFFPEYETSQESPIIGYALDGFPIYGSYGCTESECGSVVEFKSSYKLVGDPKSAVWDAYTYEARSDETYLDECNGRIGPDGRYRYHATEDFPYIVGCLKGEVTLAAGGGGGTPPQGGTGQGGPPQGGGQPQNP